MARPRIQQGPMSALVISRHAHCTTDVCFTPNSDRESGRPQPAMSALPLKADMCGAVVHVGFGPIADIGRRLGRLKRNHDFLKEKTSAPQSLYCAQGASIWPRKPNGTRYADLQKSPQHHDCEQAPTFRLASELSP